LSEIVEIVSVARQANIVDDILNVFHYRNDDQVGISGADISALLNEWISNVLPGILAFQSDQIVYLEVRGRSVTGVTFASVSLGSTDGDITGSALPPYVAYEFIYKRATALTRNGFKRFGGVIEEAIDQGGNVTGAPAAALTAAETTLETTLVDIVGFPYRPIILGRAVPPTLPLRVGEIDEIAFQRVTTQNSRKPW
jgi:hypothetical protein